MKYSAIAVSDGGIQGFGDEFRERQGMEYRKNPGILGAIQGLSDRRGKLDIR